MVWSWCVGSHTLPPPHSLTITPYSLPAATPSTPHSLYSKPLLAQRSPSKQSYTNTVGLLSPHSQPTTHHTSTPCTHILTYTPTSNPTHTSPPHSATYQLLPPQSSPHSSPYTTTTHMHTYSPTQTQHHHLTIPHNTYHHMPTMSYHQPTCYYHTTSHAITTNTNHTTTTQLTTL